MDAFLYDIYSSTDNLSNECRIKGSALLSASLIVYKKVNIGIFD